LKEQDKKKIHEAALEVMEKTGIKIHSKVARDSLKKAGALVDEKTLTVRFPRSVTTDLIKKVPQKITLAARDKELDLPCDGEHIYWTTNGTGITVWEHETRTARKSVLEDIRKSAILGDWLPYVSIYEPMVVAHDVPEKIHVAMGMKEAVNNTRKHILSESTTTPEEAKTQVKMAAEIVGGIEELKKRHIISAMVCTMSPLILEGPATDAAMVWAENHVPVYITSMAMMGMSGPATIAGDLVVDHSETLALAAAMQAHEPGSPLFYGSVLTSMDPRTGAYYPGSPESIVLGVTSAEMARYVKMPSACGGIGSSAKEPGIQSTLENAIGAKFSATIGVDVMNGMGMVGGDTMLSYEQLIIDNEIIGSAVSSQKEIPVNDETLAVDLIKQVGIGGSYLGTKLTVQKARDFYMPLLFNTDPFESWVAKGKKDFLDVAREKIEWILKNHKIEPLDRNVALALDKIVKDAI